MNLRRLKYFVKIVDVGSLTQAAEVLHIAQPALSQQLATLEGELKQQLLIRTKRGVQPTEAGNILYAHAQTILRQCEQAQSAVNSAGQAMSGQVSLGLASGSTAAQLALPLLQTLRDQQPGILLSLHENSGAALAGQVANQTLDMAMVYGAKMPAGLHTVALMREDLYLVATRAVPHPGNSVELLDVARLNCSCRARGCGAQPTGGGDGAAQAGCQRGGGDRILGRAERCDRRRVGGDRIAGVGGARDDRPGQGLDGAHQCADDVGAAVAVHVGPTVAVRPGAAGERPAAVDRRWPQPGEARAGAGALRKKRPAAAGLSTVIGTAVR